MSELKPRILIIIPAFNEEKSIANVLANVRSACAEMDVVVIDDGSKDGTAEVARRGGVRVLQHPVNLGYAASLETGYSFAIREGYQFLLQMDADGQHLSGEIGKVLAPLLADEADIVLGSRFLEPNPDYVPPLLRRLGHRFFAFLFRLLTGLAISDPTTGFQGLNTRALQLFVGRFPEDFPDTDVLLMAFYSGLRIREVGVKMLERQDGTSMHSGLKPLYYVFKMLLSMFIVMLNFKRRKA